MLTKHGILVLFAVRALSALSSPVGQFTIHDSDPYLSNLTSGQMGLDEKPKTALAVSRQVFLDDGIFVGASRGATEEFLGIPFAIPP